MKEVNNKKTNNKKTNKATTKTKSNTNKRKTTKPKSKPTTQKRKTTPNKVNKNTTISKKVPQKKLPKLEGPEINLCELEKNIEKDIKPNTKSKIKLILWLLLLIVLIFIFIIMHTLVPRMSILGDNEITINYGQTYKELGATANFLSKDLTKEIKIINNVDNSKIGTYTVIYELNQGKHHLTKVRTVKVVDKINPIINLEGNKKMNVCPDYSGFIEPGYKAVDEYDGDITDKVTVKKDKDKVTYSVEDSSGNNMSIVRELVNVDKTNPVITLKGNKMMYLGLDEEYKEPGYSASDNCSDNLTSRVVVTGSVIEGQEGTYNITYEVVDNSNNKTKVTRTIMVSKKTNPNSGNIIAGAIYLTFDDGPSNVTTGEILNILKEENVKATFFVTNNGPDYLIKRMYDEGHTVGLHTASHNYSYIYKSTDNYFADLKSVSDRVKRITGQASKIVRFPGGSSNTISRRYSSGIMTKLANELFNRGYRYYDWNVDSHDASNAKTKEAVYKNVTSNLSKNKANVILMHDIKIPTRDALRDIIKYGKDNGYTFERIDMDTKMIRQKINN